MKAKLDDAATVQAALDAAEDPETLLVQIFAELRRESPDVLRQAGAMGVTGGRPVYPIPSPQSDRTVFARLLNADPQLVAGALRRVNERTET